MKKLLNNKNTRSNLIIYLVVTVFFLVMQGMNMGINIWPLCKVKITGGKVIGTENGIVNEDGTLEITGGTIKAGSACVVVQGTTTIDADKVIFEAGEGKH